MYEYFYMCFGVFVLQGYLYWGGGGMWVVVGFHCFVDWW